MQPFRDLLISRITKVDTVEDVVFDAAREENRLLLHKCNLGLMVPLVVKILDIHASERQFTLGRIVESLDE